MIHAKSRAKNVILLHNELVRLLNPVFLLEVLIVLQ